MAVSYLLKGDKALHATLKPRRPQRKATPSDSKPACLCNGHELSETVDPLIRPAFAPGRSIWKRILSASPPCENNKRSRPENETPVGLFIDGPRRPPSACPCCTTAPPSAKSPAARCPPRSNAASPWLSSTSTSPCPGPHSPLTSAAPPPPLPSLARFTFYSRPK